MHTYTVTLTLKDRFAGLLISISLTPMIDDRNITSKFKDWVFDTEDLFNEAVLNLKESNNHVVDNEDHSTKQQ